MVGAQCGVDAACALLRGRVEFEQDVDGDHAGVPARPAGIIGVGATRCTRLKPGVARPINCVFRRGTQGLTARSAIPVHGMEAALAIDSPGEG
ncbi:hypothetical protein GCM10025759_22370 [Lysobacter panacisoli]|uniref:Uncharacterized protein n=1 Tax=Lysobacter panacisoli TaxID=1255263 RepID=A0ABP9LES2_9GAMM